MTPPALRGPLPCRFEVKNLRPFPHLALDFVILQFVDKHGVKSFDVVSYSFEPRNTQRGQVAASTRLDWRRVWHFQMVHHGLWDYDLPSAPNLIDIRVNGKDVKAVAQVSKQGFCYVFDRVTDKPIWPIEEKPVPQSPVHGERTSPTQPVPTKPAPFDRQGVTESDVINLTPELRKAGAGNSGKYNYGPLFTPPSLDKPTIEMPGIAVRRELVRRGVRPWNRDTLGLIGHASIRVQAVQVVGT
jgi:glucose dehydrogenase